MFMFYILLAPLHYNEDVYTNGTMMSPLHYNENVYTNGTMMSWNH